MKTQKHLTWSDMHLLLSFLMTGIQIHLCMTNCLKIHDGELLGNDTHVDIVTVDLFTEDDSKRCLAVKRTYAVIPESDGDGTDALIYSGTFKSASEIVKGYATSEE